MFLILIYWGLSHGRHRPDIRFVFFLLIEKPFVLPTKYIHFFLSKDGCRWFWTRNSDGVEHKDSLVVGLGEFSHVQWESK